MARPTQLEIHHDAFEHNLKVVRQHAPKARIIAMVKANGYGHGLQHVVAHTPSADAYGVCCLEEGLSVREVSKDKRVILMEGVFQADELEYVVANRFDIVVHHQAQLDMLANFQTRHPIPVWLKINTGMNRLGIPPEQTLRFYDRLKQIDCVGKVHLMTHFSDADDRQKKNTEHQIEIFHRTTGELDNEKSMANSAAILSYPISHTDWVRPGIMLYGISPFSDISARDLNLKPAMRLTSKLMTIQHCHKADSIGYGSTWVCPEDMPVGVIPIGYGDGYPRHAKSGTPIYIAGKKVPMIGRVSMDMITVDLRTCPDAKIGDDVVLWGPENPIEVIAKQADTIAYELACNITNRLPRVYC